MFQQLKYPASIKVASWNVLADSYAYGHLHDGGCREYLEWSWRKSLLEKELRLIAESTNIFLLQEVDHYEDFYKPLFNTCGFSTIYASRPGGKVDGCLIAYSSSNFEVVEYQEVQFDSIVDKLKTTSEVIRNQFKTSNVGLIAKMKSKFKDTDAETFPTFIVSCAHIYWNPARDNVKVAQCEYLMQNIESFIERETLSDDDLSKQHQISRNPPLVICAGDFNSLPESQAVKVTKRGFRLRPHKSSTSPSYVSSSSFSSSSSSSIYSHDSSLPPPPSTLLASSLNTGIMHGPETKFLCDHNLSRLCRWMRVLGFNVALESLESKKMRENCKKNAASFEALFSQSRTEHRVLLTSSKSMVHRADCPQALLIRTSDLESELVRIIKEFGLQPSRDKFLTVCGKCGGEIESCDHNMLIHGFNLPQDRDVFICKLCRQPYWWSDRLTSSPARANC